MPDLFQDAIEHAKSSFLSGKVEEIRKLGLEDLASQLESCTFFSNSLDQDKVKSIYNTCWAILRSHHGWPSAFCMDIFKMAVLLLATFPNTSKEDSIRFVDEGLILCGSHHEILHRLADHFDSLFVKGEVTVKLENEKKNFGSSTGTGSDVWDVFNDDDEDEDYCSSDEDEEHDRNEDEKQGRGEVEQNSHIPSILSTSAKDKSAMNVQVGIQNPIQRLEVGPSLADFVSTYYEPQLPVIFSNSTLHWSASTKWRNLDWWKAKHGHRTVPTEVGVFKYKDGLKEKLLTIREVIDQYLKQSLEKKNSRQVCYIAQHPLFDHLKDLRSDFQPPKYCSCSASQLQKMNAWIGTDGTITPLHFDSYDNFLTQVAGYKYVRLYAPSETKFLYVDDQGDNAVTKQGNISQVDVRHPNLNNFPLFQKATYYETILGPSDQLYIPKKWWHFVQGLTVSISVNFWF
eukprot:g4940.t1